LRLIYGKPISNTGDILSALNACHEKGIQTVIVSSSKSFDEAHKNQLVLYASSKGIYAQSVQKDMKRLKLHFCCFVFKKEKRT
jgi:pyridoxal/pyridoxine/pyridoxamine kinase